MTYLVEYIYIDLINGKLFIRGGDRMTGAPLNDEIINSISQLIDDSQIEPKREPTHSDLEFHFKQIGLDHIDPRKLGRTVGKAKRVREVLYWTIENNAPLGEKLVLRIISIVKAAGGFRKGSKNFTGDENIQNLREAFKSEGYILTLEGELIPVILENLTEREMKEALKSYVRRARHGVADAALLTGTGKDLMEAVAAYVLFEKTGSYSKQANFPTLLGQAFTYLGLATPQDQKENNESAQRRFERALYELACSVNNLRNKEGTGHGRPFITNISTEESIAAVESIGLVSEYLLNKMEVFD